MTNHLTEAQAATYRNLLIESGFILNPHGEPTPPVGMGAFWIDKITKRCRQQALEASRPRLRLVEKE